jgi:cytochrome P450
MSATYRHVDHSSDFEPTEAYRQLRDHCPLHHEADHDPPFYVLSRFADVVEALRRPDQWRNQDGPGVFYQERGVLGTTDEPDHGRHRRVLRSAFVPTSIERLAPRIGAIADDLLDAFVAGGAADFVERFAAPFPALAIAELLGVHDDDRAGFGHWSNIAVAALTGGDVEAYLDAKTILEDYVEAGVEQRLAAPADERPDDVLTLLAGALADATIDRREARHLGYQLLVAGHETTTSLLGMMLFRLIERPDLMQRLRSDRSLLPNAIEEALRFDSPVQGLFRTNAEQCVVHGETVAPGSKVQMLFAAANRDPAEFDEPDRFDVDRDRRQLGHHLAFGWGIHFCIGAPLARLEARIAFERILDRMHDIRLAGPPQRNDSFVLHGLTSLPITWSVTP